MVTEERLLKVDGIDIEGGGCRPGRADMGAQIRGAAGDPVLARLRPDVVVGNKAGTFVLVQ